MKHKRTTGRYFQTERFTGRNTRALSRTFLFMLVIVLIYSVLFQLIMRFAEGIEHSLITGFYWTLMTMSTTGYGDIVFQSNMGRMFSLLVILTGIVSIFVVLPYIFIQYLYAPLMEAQIRKRTPREVPPETEGHVIICLYDKLASGFIRLLEQERISYFVIEPDLEVAATRYHTGVSVVVGDVDNCETYRALRADSARMILANLSDPENTNVALTVREVAPSVPIAAIAHMETSVEILRQCGVTHVLPLQRWLGEQLANRVNASRAQAHILGHYKDLFIAELPVHMTPLSGKTIRETRLRETTGISIVAVWQRGHLQPARPDLLLTPTSVPVIMGTEEQLDELDYLLAIYDYNPNPVVIVGGGPVGLAAARALSRKEVPVHLIDRERTICARARSICENVIQGDATDPAVLIEAGVDRAPSVLLTTSDDALNIFLAAHCRQLNKEVRIVSRITRDHNIEAIHKAGADLVLGSASLGVEATFSLLKGKELVVLGEGVDLFSIELPPSLDGKSLAQSEIGARTALTVIAIQENGSFITNPSASTMLRKGMDLVMFGDSLQRQKFVEMFGESNR